MADDYVEGKQQELSLGSRLQQKAFAPETAVGTGAAEPVVDEYEAAKAVPSVDESTIEGGRSQNFVHETKTIAYSGEDSADGGNDEVSNGQDYETRNADNDDVPLAGAAVSDSDDAEVNKSAEEVRPKAPQATKKERKEEGTV